MNPATKVVKRLNKLAQDRNRSLAQMALAWVLRKAGVTSALIGASRVCHIEEAVSALENLEYTDDELKKVDRILAS